MQDYLEALLPRVPALLECIDNWTELNPRNPKRPAIAQYFKMWLNRVHIPHCFLSVPSIRDNPDFLLPKDRAVLEGYINELEGLAEFYRRAWITATCAAEGFAAEPDLQPRIALTRCAPLPGPRLSADTEPKTFFASLRDQLGKVRDRVCEMNEARDEKLSSKNPAIRADAMGLYLPATYSSFFRWGENGSQKLLQAFYFAVYGLPVLRGTVGSDQLKFSEECLVPHFEEEQYPMNLRERLSTTDAARPFVT